MTRVLLTGGSGLIGTTLREHFAEKSGHGESWEVISVDRIAPKEEFEFFEQHERCDLLDREHFTEIARWHKPDVLLHVAAQARVEPSVADPLGTYDLNVQATLNVLHAARDARVPHAIVTSSEAIYGNAREYPSRENNDFNPGNPYAASKVAVDVMGQQFDSVVPTCVVRSGMGFGKRSQPSQQIVARFITRALRNESLRFPTGEVVHPTRDLNHVGDFCEGVQKIIEKKARGVYNLSGGREYSVLQIAELILKVVGSGYIEFDPTFKYRPGEEGARTWLDVTKAKHDLGHEPKRHFDDQKVLQDIVAWYRDNPNYFS